MYKCAVPAYLLASDNSVDLESASVDAVGTRTMTDHTKPVANNVAALLSELEEHRRQVGQALARDDLAEARDAHVGRRADTRRKIILGGAAMAEARDDPEFAKTMMSVLRRRVSDPRDRTLLALDMDQIPDPIRPPSAEEFDAMVATLPHGLGEPQH
jgi:hypothetical protein